MLRTNFRQSDEDQPSKDVKKLPKIENKMTTTLIPTKRWTEPILWAQAHNDFKTCSSFVQIVCAFNAEPYSSSSLYSSCGPEAHAQSS